MMTNRLRAYAIAVASLATLTAALATAALATTSVAGQAKTPAFDNTAWQKGQPTYMHNPVTVRIGDKSVNLHAVAVWEPLGTDVTVVTPGGKLMIPYEEFDFLMAKYTRRGVWPNPEMLP